MMSFALAPTFSWAQGSQTYQAPGPKKQLATIIFAGLGGAALGLSTLSFYGKPQEKLNNITVGFAVGVIVGTIYTTYQAATRPHAYYSLLESEALRDFERNQDRALLARSGAFEAPLSYQISF